MTRIRSKRLSTGLAQLVQLGGINRLNAVTRILAPHRSIPFKRRGTMGSGLGATYHDVASKTLDLPLGRQFPNRLASSPNPRKKRLDGPVKAMS